MIKYNFDELDNMTTEELERIVDEDAQKPVKEQLDDDILLYILGILDRRGGYDDAMPDVEDARIAFLEEYLEIGERNKENKPKRRWGVSILKTACIAVVTTIVLFAATVTAAAAGYDVRDSIAEWTHATFKFHHVGEVKYKDNKEVAFTLESAYGFLRYAHGVEYAVMPTWLPEGYSCRDYVSGAYNGGMSCMVKVENGENVITLQYVMATYSGGLEYAKDNSEPETYEAEGITHYIMLHNGKYKAIWRNGVMECSINGVESYEDLIKIIDSIYE